MSVSADRKVVCGRGHVHECCNCSALLQCVPFLHKDTLKQGVALEVVSAVIEETLLEAEWREDEPAESLERRLEEEAGPEGSAVWCVRASPSIGHSYY